MNEEVVRTRRWTREGVELAFREFAAIHGRSPKYEELGTHGLPWPRSVDRTHGGFNKAVRAAGLRSRRIGRPRRGRIAA